VNSRRARRGPRNAAIAASTAAVVVAGVLMWQLLPASTPQNRADEPRSAPSTPAGSVSPATPSQSTPGKSTRSSVPGNLHTPTGMRAMIAKIKTAIGGSKVVRLTVYPTYASVDAPVKGDPEIYDRYDYRDGEVTRSGPGSKVTTPVVDLDKYNWDALPALLKAADKDLGVTKPTTHYVIVDPDYAFASPRQVLLVYVADSYRSGYLVANLQGKVVKKYPDD
jgi:hypothetical protein